MTNDPKCLVVDANILLGAVFGVRVLHLLISYADVIDFYTPDMCFEEAKKHIPAIALRKNVSVAAAFEFAKHLQHLVEPVSQDLYQEQETAARRRIASRDVNDWPVLAISLSLNCPIWTEDQDFFGTGVATWTTPNVELYLEEA